MRIHQRLFIGTRWAEPSGAAAIDVVSPFSEEVVGRVPEAGPSELEAAVAAARAALRGSWATWGPAERADALTRLAQGLKKWRDEMTATIVAESGSPVGFAKAYQAMAAPFVLGYYAEMVGTRPFEERRPGITGEVLVTDEPVGVVGAIVPFNATLAASINKLAPALAAGCTVIVKPPPETPLNTFLLAEAAEEAGLPEGVLSILPGGRDLGAMLVHHPGVDMVSFTGSTAAGQEIAVACGQRIARCALELGGKSAALLLDDVDLDTAVPAILDAGFVNSGQACAAQTRLLIPQSRYDETVDALVDCIGSLPVGDPADPEVRIGPLVSPRQRERVEEYISLGLSEGAELAVGGRRPRKLDRGWFVEPTLLVNVDNRMRVAREEIFGPVLVAIPYDGDEEGLALAEDSEYGLAGSVWTGDAERGVALARRIRAGSVSVNRFALDVCAPFGGFKASGIGRELGPEGLSAFLEPRAISLPAATGATR